MCLRSEYFPVRLFRHNLVARSPAQGAEVSRLIGSFFRSPCGTTREFGELPESGRMINAKANKFRQKPTAAFYSYQGRNGPHPRAGPARAGCRSHRSPTWLQCQHAQGPLLTGSDQPARAQRGQGSAARATLSPSRQSRQSRSGPMSLHCRPHCN